MENLNIQLKSEQKNEILEQSLNKIKNSKDNQEKAKIIKNNLTELVKSNLINDKLKFLLFSEILKQSKNINLLK